MPGWQAACLGMGEVHSGKKVEKRNLGLSHNSCKARGHGSASIQRFARNRDRFADSRDIADGLGELTADAFLPDCQQNRHHIVPSGAGGRLHRREK